MYKIKFVAFYVATKNDLFLNWFYCSGKSHSRIFHATNGRTAEGKFF